MPFKPDAPETEAIATKGAKIKNKQYTEHYRKWLIRKDDAGQPVKSKKTIQVRREKYHDPKKSCWDFGERSKSLKTDS